VAATKNKSESSEGLPGWAWALIGAGAVALVVLAFNAVQRSRKKGSAADPADASSELQGQSLPPDDVPPGQA